MAFAGSHSGVSAQRQTLTARPVRAGQQARNRRTFRVQAAVKVGDKAPDFELLDQNGKSVKLSKYQGLFGKSVVLYFYPSDGSPGCTKQANAFKDNISSLKSAGAEVIGVSKNDVQSHLEFRSKLNLPFPLLADEGSKVRELYGVKKDLLGLLDGRQTYIIDKQGTVKAIYNNQFDSESHAQEALKALQG